MVNLPGVKMVAVSQLHCKADCFKFAEASYSTQVAAVVVSHIAETFLMPHIICLFGLCDGLVCHIGSVVQITAAPPMPMGPPGANRGFGQPQFQRQ